MKLQQIYSCFESFCYDVRYLKIHNMTVMNQFLELLRLLIVTSCINKCLHNHILETCHLCHTLGGYE